MGYPPTDRLWLTGVPRFVIATATGPPVDELISREYPQLDPTNIKLIAFIFEFAKTRFPSEARGNNRLIKFCPFGFVHLIR